MKFTAAALLAAVGFSDATKLINKRALMRGAVPVDSSGNRRLDANEFQISAEYSIKFNHCLSLKISADEYEDVLFDENVIAYTKEGKVLAQTSYVLFNVCKTENCYYEDDETLYMVDLATYMGSLIEGSQQKSEQFCEACNESYETCYANQYDEAQEGNQEGQEQQDGGEQQEAEGEQQEGGEGDQEQQEGEGEGDGEGGEGEGEGERRLSDVVYYDNQGYIVVDCDTCEAKGCFEADEQQQYDENNANYQITDQVIEEWIQGMLECVDTEVVGPTGEDNLYAGFMCNADGSGVEPAIFLDNACAVYTSMYSYGNVVSGTTNYDIMYKAADAVTTPFLNTESCEYIEYISIEGAENLAYEANQQAQNGQNQNNNNEEQAAEAAETCRNLMNDAIDLDTCGGYEDDGNQDEEEDVYEEGDEDYSWYEYLVAQDAANDAQGTCVVVAALQGEYSTAHTYTQKDSEGGGSGHVYDYKSSRAFGGGDMSAGKIFGIIIAVIVALVAAVLVMQSLGGKKDTKKDTKKVPLVNNKSGAMA